MMFDFSGLPYEIPSNSIEKSKTKSNDFCKEYRLVAEA